MTAQVQSALTHIAARLKLNQSELAKALGLNQSTVSRIVRGKQAPQIETIQAIRKLARERRIGIGDLLDEKPPARPENASEARA